MLRQVLLLRLSPLLPFALSNYLYGMTKVNFFEYLAGTAIGFAPGSLGFVMSGQIGRDLLGVEEAGRCVRACSRARVWVWVWVWVLCFV